MPLRDWTRVPGCVYHDFHTGFLVAIRRVLNSGVLPEGYYALADQSHEPHRGRSDSAKSAWRSGTRATTGASH
jgi:hypothetical protein